MIKNNQIWENTSRIAKLEKNDGGIRAVIFKITSYGLQFDSIICSGDEDIEKHLKKLRMRLTNKSLVVE